MSSPETLPELKEIIGAMLFAAKGAVTPKQIRRVFLQVAEDRGGMFAHFADVKEKQVAEILDEIHGILQESHLGFSLHEVAGGLRLQNNLNCGPWVRELLEKGKPNRLSRPALETLAIIAYRQPCVKSEIEGVRGVAVDAILKRLLEMQLVKITGRSELPGRPLFFGTTQKFLEHFGLKSLEELPGISELRRVQEEKNRMADAEEELEDGAEGGAAPETDEEASAAFEEPAEPSDPADPAEPAEPAEENPTEEPDEEPVEKGPVASDGDLDESYDVDEEDEEYEDEDEDEDD
ncbi:MAG: SMC-Scp complex subunit ScpB [Kiritimatiellae bacterium]|nr:SMC-Scp complex subunit ScpB [Kiritimatiellia bacterium]